MLQGRIFLTGGSGFLSRGIMRYAKNHNWPCEFTVYSRNAEKQVECRAKYPEACYILGDIRDTDRLALAMLHHDIVIHTAALKHIPEAENNVAECISINIGGVSSVIQAVRESNKVHTCVGISTDKAVEPMNIYGLTKAIGERMFVEAAKQTSDRKFVQTRYGNVIGSSGSVIPVFKRMEAECNRVSITDPNMTRFWLSINDAVELIIAAMGAPSGDITVPSPQAMCMEDLVSTITPGAKRVFIGLRPGEKMHEKLLTRAESGRILSINGNYILTPNNLTTYSFEVISDDPPGGWLQANDLLDGIYQAEAV